MVALFCALATLIIAAGGEALHGLRIRKLSALVFGPGVRPSLLSRLAPAARVLALTALAWGIPTLFVQPPQTLEQGIVRDSQKKHVLLLMDVSPSMRLVDAGEGKLLSRAERAKAVLMSFFDRVPIQQYRISLIAFYDKAIPVVVDTTDLEVVVNALSGLPLHFAFKGPKTNLFEGLKTVTEIVRPWNPGSTTLLVISDGDTVPSTGMPRMPPSVSGVLVVGIGDPVAGKFIDGRHSRQDVSTLRQVAARSGGEYHNGNQNQISTGLIRQLTADRSRRRWQDLSMRELAMAAVCGGAVVLGALPLWLHFFGSRWHPGIRRAQVQVASPFSSR